MLRQLMVLAIALSVGGPAEAKCNNTLKIGCGSGPKMNSGIKNIPSQMPRAPKQNVPFTPGKKKNPSALTPTPPQAQAQPNIIPGAPQSQRRPGIPATNVAQGGNVLYKHVCQASQTWCYLNATTPIEQGKTCHCRGDIGKIK